MAPKLFMKPKHSNLESLYKEKYGLGEFDDSFGGVDGRNKMYGSKWRSHIDRQHYSRAMRVVQAIGVTAKANGSSWKEAVNELEPVFQEANKSVANIVKKLQEKGIISKGKTRGVKRKISKEDSEEASCCVSSLSSSLSSSGVLRGVLQFCCRRRQYWGVRGDVALSRESCYLESLFGSRHSSQNTCV
jgi:hypothetical protein